MFVALVKPSDSPVSVLGRMSMPTFVTAASKRWIGGHSFAARWPTSVDCTNKHSDLDPIFSCGFLMIWLVMTVMTGSRPNDVSDPCCQFCSAALSRPPCRCRGSSTSTLQSMTTKPRCGLEGSSWRMVIRKVIPHHLPGDSICLTDDSSPRMFPNCLQKTSKNKALNLEFQSLINRLWTAIH